jgi:hypothetical protein
MVKPLDPGDTLGELPMAQRGGKTLRALRAGAGLDSVTIEAEPGRGVGVKILHLPHDHPLIL